jgi:hypothetical protein
MAGIAVTINFHHRPSRRVATPQYGGMERRGVDGLSLFRLGLISSSGPDAGTVTQKRYQPTTGKAGQRRLSFNGETKDYKSVCDDFAKTKILHLVAEITSAIASRGNQEFNRWT